MSLRPSRSRGTMTRAEQRPSPSWAWPVASPGAPDLPAFWRQLEAGAETVTDERREAAPWEDFVENLPARYGAYHRAGFVAGIDEFDARFFHISPIEARLMDPQQRMLLETTWQALEDAGIDPDRLKGSRTGVYAGVASSEYRDLMRGGDYGIGYLSTAASMAVGRVAFQFGLEGPTVPLELNCASSLIAVHQAVTSLRLGESDLALVGGTNAILSAGITREMADLRLLSPEGRCKSFDASADGFVRGEGCGMVVLKRLSEAESDGDRIWAVIRGSAFNQNGATAAATVPNGPAQERLIEQALAQAGVAPSEVDYLEAHGAGSAFGDPIEVQAASAVYGKGRPPDRPLLMGSVKTNIGHLEFGSRDRGPDQDCAGDEAENDPAATSLGEPEHARRMGNAAGACDDGGGGVAAGSGSAPRAGVSAFGISGVNAHVVLEGYGSANAPRPGTMTEIPMRAPRGRVLATLPEQVASLPPSEDAFSARNSRLLPLSGKSDESLRALAERYLSWLDEHADALSASLSASDPLLSDMAWTAAIGRSHFGHRAGVVFQDAASLRRTLTELAHAEEGPGPRTATKVAFVCTGEANRWVAMARRSTRASRWCARCSTAATRCSRGSGGLAARRDVGTRRAGGSPGRSRVDAARDIRTGVRAHCAVGERRHPPSVVAGQGAGEIAAARAAGLFSLEDGLRLAAAGSEPEAALESVAIAAPSAVLVNGLTGRVVDPDQILDGAYWLREQAGDPQKIGGLAGRFAELGVEVVIEIGPDAVLSTSVAEAWPNAADNAAAPTVLSSLRRPSGGDEEPDGYSDCGFVEAVARAYQAGLGVSFTGLFAGETRRRVSLPSYPFQRRRFWLSKPKEQAGASG